MRRLIAIATAALALLVGGLASGTALGSSPASGQELHLGQGTGSPVSASSSSLSLSWSIVDAPGSLSYIRPCSVFVSTVPSSSAAGAPTFAVGEDDTSWQGVVDVAPGQTVYLGILGTVTPIGVDTHDCSAAGFIGAANVTIAPYTAPPPPPTTTTTAVTTTDVVTTTVTVADPDLTARVSALEQRQAVNEARITALERNAGLILGEPKNTLPFTASN